MKSFRVFAAIGLVALLLSATLPWLTVNILGQYNITLLDIYRYILKTFQTAHPTQTQPSESTVNYLSSITAILASIIIYPISLILTLLSTFFRRATLPAGVLATLAGILWFFGIESFKGKIIQQASGLGGLSGMLSSMFANVLASAFQVGYGAYVPILAGLIILLAYFVEAQKRPRSSPFRW